MTNPNQPGESTPPQWSAPGSGPSAPGAPTPPAGSGAPAPYVPVAAPPPGPAVPSAPVSSVPRPTRKRGAIDIVLVVAAVFAVGGIGFAVGRVTAPAATVAAGNGTFRAGNGGTGGQFGNGGTGGGQFGNGGPGGTFFGGGGAAGITITGEVTDVAADHLTLKLASGQTIQVPIDSSTTYHSQAPATSADVTTGATVQVQLARGGGNGGPNASPGTGGGTGGGRGFLGSASSVTVVPK